MNDPPKMVYRSTSGRYAVVYDVNGDYFRIEDLTRTDKSRYTDLDGNPMENITENGRTRGRSKCEYESATHFKNSDKGRAAK